MHWVWADPPFRLPPLKVEDVRWLCREFVQVGADQHVDPRCCFVQVVAKLGIVRALVLSPPSDSKSLISSSAMSAAFVAFAPSWCICRPPKRSASSSPVSGKSPRSALSSIAASKRSVSGCLWAGAARMSTCQTLWLKGKSPSAPDWRGPPSIARVVTCVFQLLADPRKAPCTRRHWPRRFAVGTPLGVLWRFCLSSVSSVYADHPRCLVPCRLLRLVLSSPTQSKEMTLPCPCPARKRARRSENCFDG